MTSWLDHSNTWYNTHTNSFKTGAAACDPSLDLTKFTQSLPQHATILDVGCGTGRDLNWLHNKGFLVEGLEPSSALATIAQQEGHTIHQNDLLSFTPTKLYQGIWCMAVLMHMPLTTWPDALEKIASMLATKGIAHIHVKEGNGESFDPQGRPLALIAENTLLQMAENIPYTTHTLRRQIAKTSTQTLVPWLTLELTKCA